MSAGLLVLVAAARRGARARASLPAAKVLRTGMGPDRARIAAARALARRRACAVAVAGALRRRRARARARRRRLRRPELDRDGRRPGRGAGQRAARGRAAPARRCASTSARSLSADRIVGPGRAARASPARALAVDMESAWLAAGAGGRPLAVVRVVADAAGRRLADPRHARSPASRALRSLRRVGGGARRVGARRSGRARCSSPAPRSFCAGVERAIEIVELALEQRGAPVYVRKQIVHNEHVVADLERRGAVFVEELDEVPDGATVVFSAHGVSPAVRDDAAGARLDVIDATCPLVSKVHAEARRFAAEGTDDLPDRPRGPRGGRGDARRGAGRDPARRGRRAGRARSRRPIPSASPYLTQTTLAVDETDEIVDALRERFPALRGPASDDICYATSNRQHAVRAVAREADVVLVVGSRDLVELAAAGRGRPARGRPGLPGRRRDRASTSPGSPGAGDGRDHRRRLGARADRPPPRRRARRPRPRRRRGANDRRPSRCRFRLPKEVRARMSVPLRQSVAVGAVPAAAAAASGTTSSRCSSSSSRSSSATSRARSAGRSSTPSTS